MRDNNFRNLCFSAPLNGDRGRVTIKINLVALYSPNTQALTLFLTTIYMKTCRTHFKTKTFLTTMSHF